VRLLADRAGELRTQAIAWRVTGVASRRLGWLANPHGFNPALLDEQFPRKGSDGGGQIESVPLDRVRSLDGPPETTYHRLPDVHSWLRAAQADVLFEATSLNVENGQPAVDHLRAALEFGAHAITANKGPIVHAYADLHALARRQDRHLFFESTVMDGIPIFSLFRENLPSLRLQGFRGILNSTTNVVLGGMEEGLSFEASLQKAQELGVAETDASHDLDGWDAAVKVAALVIVLMNEPLKLAEIRREGIRGLTGEQVREARAAGTPYKLVCEARRGTRGVEARVTPQRLPLTDALARVAGTSSIIEFHTDIFPGLVLTEQSPGIYATAYGMLADFIRAAHD
jgi:homoserine dehydrogenase